LLKYINTRIFIVIDKIDEQII